MCNINLPDFMRSGTLHLALRKSSEYTLLVMQKQLAKTFFIIQSKSNENSFENAMVEQDGEVTGPVKQGDMGQASPHS